MGWFAPSLMIVSMPSLDATPSCRQKIASYKVPEAVEFIAALPKNPTGKVLKKELRAPR